MSEIEVPLESVQEELHHHGQHAKESWVGKVALASALFAGIAAIAALLAGHLSNEAMIEQIQASDKWAFFQAKGVKASILKTRMEILESMGKSSVESDQKKLDEYKAEQEEISHEAKEKELESRHHLHVHETLATSVTMFQVAIAIAAISVLTKKRRFWLVGLAFGCIGLTIFVFGLWNLKH